MPKEPKGQQEIEVVRLAQGQHPPHGEEWIMVHSNPGHEETMSVHSSGQTYVTTPDRLEMDIYNAIENARGLGLRRIYVKED